MKHNLMHRIVMLLAAVVLLAACSKGPDMAAYIPSNSFLVADINVGDLMKKADVKNIENISFVKLGLQELRHENPEMAELIDKIIDDPTETGLDLRKDVAVYVTQDMGFAVIAAMHKKSRFEKFLRETAEEGDELVFEEMNGYNKATTDFGTILYNKEVAVLTTSFGNDLSSTMNLKKDGSMAGNKKFADYWRNRSEMSIWADYGSMINFAERMGGNALVESGLPKEYLDDMKNMSMAWNLYFDKGAFRSEITSQGFNTKKYKDYYQKFNSDLLKMLPEKSYLFFSFAMNAAKAADMYAGMNIEDVDFNEPLVGDKSLLDIIRALKGSVAFSIFDLVENEQTTVMPLMAIVADISDAATVQQIIDAAGMEARDGYYYANVGSGIEIYVAKTDKYLYITNSQDAVTKFIGGGFGKGIDGSIASKAKNYFYMYANLDVNTYPQAVVKLIPQNVTKLLGNYFESFELYNTSDTGVESYLYIKDKKENSLLSTLHFIDNNLVELGNLTEQIGGGDESPVYEEEYYVDDDFDEDPDESLWED